MSPSADYISRKDLTKVIVDDLIMLNNQDYSVSFFNSPVHRYDLSCKLMYTIAYKPIVMGRKMDVTWFVGMGTTSLKGQESNHKKNKRRVISGTC